MRQDLMANQGRELGEVQVVYNEETAKFHHIWDARIKDYAAGLQKVGRAGQAYGRAGQAYAPAPISA